MSDLTVMLAANTIARQEWDEPPEVFYIKGGELISWDIPEYVWERFPPALSLAFLVNAVVLGPEIIPGESHPPEGWEGIAFRFETWSVNLAEGSEEEKLGKQIDRLFEETEKNPDARESRIMYAYTRDGSWGWARFHRGDDTPEYGEDNWGGLIATAIKALVRAWEAKLG